MKVTASLKRLIADDSAQHPEAKRWQHIGLVPQGAMILAFMASESTIEASHWWPGRIVGFIGAALFVWCLWALYIKAKRITGLITSGPFRFTRHPMYIGLLLMMLGISLPVPHPKTDWFYVSVSVFAVSMLIAGWCQEKETLARFGDEARSYYARTKRIPFIW